ncbi:MAG: hypothetical protein J0I93_07185 [Legionella sp.]|nr:hypothetical protein [Legionella sp.]
MRPENLAQHEECIRLQQQLQKILDLSSSLPSSSTKKPSLLSRYPLLSSFFRGDSEVGNDVSQLGSSLGIVQPTTPPALNDGLQLGSVVLAIVDFIRVPLVYLMAFILRENVPFSLSNNARWVYSASLLGLAIVSLIVPALASIFAITAAAVTLSFSIFLLGKSLWERAQLSHALGRAQKNIIMEEDAIQLLLDEARVLQVELKKTPLTVPVIDFEAEISSLHQRLMVRIENLLSRKAESQHIQSKIKKLGIQKIMDRTLGITFASVTLIGVILGLFLPQISLIILTSISVLSLGYFIGRLTENLWVFLHKKVNALLEGSASIGAEVGSDVHDYVDATRLMLKELDNVSRVPRADEPPMQSSSLFQNRAGDESCAAETISSSTNLKQNEITPS